ncbi:hypothetical protein COU59_03310 [Candidatus Pacearchaeota archaeon CG10_big_fil_rev_8_21_14_0_10_34_12]|nr:MAG: hypothetical protein COU59_03310 [Candidatus Pacearchaeota archaeon CG10_big_fil_rev_8_21_14_0_10_34_12]
MKIALYSIPNCIHAEAFKIFLKKNNLPHKEIKINNENIHELRKLSFQDKISILKVTKSHGITIFTGFNEYSLNLNIIEHIKKYNPKIRT